MGTSGEQVMLPEMYLTGGTCCSLEQRSKQTPTLGVALDSSTSPECPLSSPKHYTSRNTLSPTPSLDGQI